MSTKDLSSNEIDRRLRNVIGTALVLFSTKGLKEWIEQLLKLFISFVKTKLYSQTLITTLLSFGLTQGVIERNV